jgi:hypothetical protein
MTTRRPLGRNVCHPRSTEHPAGRAAPNSWVLEVDLGGVPEHERYVLQSTTLNQVFCPLEHPAGRVYADHMAVGASGFA